MARMSVVGRWRSRAVLAAGLSSALALLGVVGPMGTSTAGATPSSCTNTAAITLGAPATSGNIAAAGQVDCYTFSGATGDRVHIHVEATSGTLVPSTSVSDPSDSTICGPTTDADQVCTLTADGSQTISVADSTGTETGGYTVFAEVLLDGCSTMSTITLGASAKSGSIDSAGQADCYTFTGTTGERVHVHVVATSGTLVPNTSVIDGAGATVCAATTDADQTCTLTSDGIQAIEIADSTSTETGGYTVFAEVLLDGCSTMHTISLDAPAKSGTISAAGQSDCYTFSGLTGDKVHVRVVATDGTLVPDTSVLDATGATVCAATTDANQICTLTSDGTQAIKVEDSTGTETGDYTVFAQDVVGSCSDMSSISLGAPASSGTIADAGQIDCWRFSGSIGDRIHMELGVTDGSLVPSASVIDDTGATICAPSTDADQTCRLTESGGFSIAISDESGTNTGDYTIFAERLPVTCATTRAIGFGTQAKVGNIDGDDVALCYSFTARKNDKVRVRVVAASGTLTPSTTLLNPGGATTCGPSTAIEQTCVIGTTGVNTIMVRDQLGTNTGTIGVYIQRLRFPLRCTAISIGGVAINGRISIPGDADCYSFRLGGARRVRVRVVATDGSIVPNTEIIDAGGQALTRCGPTTATDIDCRLVSERYNRTILVRDLEGPNIGSYSISLQQFPAPVGCGQIRAGATALTGRISVPGNADCYTFAGTGGHHMRVRVVATDGTLVPYTELINTNGTTACGPTTDLEMHCRLPGTGKETLMIRDFAGPNTGGYAVYLQDLDAPRLCGTVTLGAPALAGSITVAPSARCYTFTGASGTHVKFDVEPVSGTLVPQTEVLTPAGTTLCGPTTDAVQVCKLNGSGTYVIFIRDAAGSGTGDFTVAAGSP